MPSQYSDDIKAQAQALIRQGQPAVSVARSLELPERTVSYWAHNWRQIAAEEEDRELLDSEYRIARKAGALVLEALDSLVERDPEDLSKHLFGLNVVKGTSIDKIIKYKELSKPLQETRQLVIVVNNPMLPSPEPVTIEVEADR